MKTHAYIPHAFSPNYSVRTPLLTVLLLVGLLAAPAGFAGVGTDTWSGAGAATATTGWDAAANWAVGSANATPGAGDSLFFTGSANLANGDDIVGALSIGGLTFGSVAGPFTLGATSGNSLALTATAVIADNSSSLETINLPIALGGASQNINVVRGGSLTINNVISGTGPLLLTGGGLLTLTGQAAGANTYSGGTTNNGGTLELDFSQGGSTPASGILGSGTLTLGGGSLIVNGSSATANLQAFTGTTLNPGQNIIKAVNGASGGSATVTLSALTVSLGASVVFQGPASATAGVAATGTITTTTAGLGQATAAQDGVLATAAENNAYATVGLYDWASTDIGAVTAGTSPYTIIGGSSISGFYLVPGNNVNPAGTPNWDIATQENPLSFSAGTTARESSTTTFCESIRFNTGIAPYLDVKGGDYLETGGLLVTPNLGVINVGVCNVRLANTTCQIVQNNTTGLLIIGIDSTSTSIWQAFTGAAITDTGDNIVKSGAGTLILNPTNGMGFPINYTNGGAYTVSTSGRVTAGTYDSVDVANNTPAAFYFNGGVTVINNPNQLGNPTTQGTTAGAVGTVNLNGGTLMGAMGSFSLINAAAASAARPVFLGGNGGGLAAQTTNTFTIPCVISGASGTGPLSIGIPASSANGNNVGLVPGTGSIGGYVTKNPAFNATGTVALTGVNTYTGNTIISSGTLQLGAAGSISNSANIIVNSGANFDVSQVSGGFTLGTNQVQNLMGSGLVTGAVVVASGSGIYGGTDGTYGTNTFNSNLTLATGAAAYFDLGTSATGPNDEIVVNGNLTLNGNIIHLKAPSTTAFLDTSSYTLFTSPIPITINGSLTIVWDVSPANSGRYSVLAAGNSVLLQYVAGSGPIVGTPTASPNPAYPNEGVLISVTVLTNNNPVITSVTADVSQTAGTGQPGSGATIKTLYLSAIPNVYTNSVVVGASVPIGSTTTNIVTAVDSGSSTTYATNVLSIISGAPTISPVSVSPNPAGLNQMATITATVLGNSYPVSVGGVTVDVSAIAGTSPGTTILTMNLSATPNVYTNSYTVLNTTAYGAQTLTVKAVDTDSETTTAALTLNVSPLDVWTGLGADNNWMTGGNWQSGLTPGTGDFVTFAGSTQLTPDMNNNYTLGSLTFAPAAGPFNITDPTASYTLTLTGGVTNNSANVQTLGVPVALTGAQTLNAAAGSIVVSNTVSDSGSGLVKAGTNTLTLSGNNTYTGPTTINAGSVVIAGSGQLGGGTYAAGVADNGIFDYASSAAQTLSGAISGGGVLRNDAGALTLPNANTYSGGTLINGGVVSIANATSLGTGNVTNNGGSILMPPAAALTVANNLWFTSTSFIDQNNYAGNNNFSGTFSGNGTLMITNLTYVSTTTYSTFTLAGSMANFSGHVIIAPTNSSGAPTAGTLRFNSGTTQANTGSTNASFNLGDSPSTALLASRNPGTINLGELLGGPGTAAEGTRNAGIGVLSIGGLNTSTTFAGTIEDVDPTETAGTLFTAITKVGNGTLTLTGANTYSGITAINGGFLNAGVAENPGVSGPFGNPTTNAITFGGGTLQYSAVNQNDYSARFSTNGSQPISIDVNGQSVSFATVIQGIGTSLKLTNSTSSGTLTLNAAETYTGNTAINGGTLALGASGSINSTNIIVGAGATYDVSAVSGYTVGAGQNLMGYGAVNGSVNTTSGSGIYGGQDGIYGTNMFNNDLTLVTGAAAHFDVGTSATGSNDEIVVNGNLTLNNTYLHVKAPSTSASLSAANYTLFSSPNPITVNGTITLIWDVQPANFNFYQPAVVGNTIVLKYGFVAGPQMGASSATPNPAYPYGSELISATVVPNPVTLNPINNVTADVSQTAGTAHGTTIIPLYLSSTPNVYTNSVNVGAAVPAGTVTNYVTAVDSASIPDYSTNTLGILSGFPVISVQPTSRSFHSGAVGATASFAGAATGSQPMYYQWKAGAVGGSTYTNLLGGQFSGTTTTNLVISNLTLGNVASYVLVASNSFGSITSSPAILTAVDAGAYGDVVAGLSPVALYELNELADPSVGGVTAYDYVGGHNGTYGTNSSNGFDGIAGPRPLDFPGFTTTNTALATTTNLANSFVTLPALNLNTNTVTLTAWINPSDYVGGSGIVLCNDGTKASGLVSYGSGGNGISLNFVGPAGITAWTSTESAGFVTLSNWNTIQPPNNNDPCSGTTALVDSTGAATGATCIWSSSYCHEATSATSGNPHLFATWLDATDGTGRPSIVTVTNLPSSAAGYNVYVYCGGSAEGGTFSIAYPGSTSPTYTVTGTGIFAANTWTQVTGANVNGNYILWTIPGVSGFTITDVTSGRAPLNGVQIIPLSGGASTTGAALGYNWNGDSTAAGWNSGLVPPTNQWSLAALVVSPTNATIYMLNHNGIASATLTNNHAITAFAGNTLIGSSSASSQAATFDGSIDDVGVFNYGLTPAQLQSIFATGAYGPGPMIMAYAASPNPAYPNEKVLVSATVLPNPNSGNAVSSVSADVSRTAGTVPGTTILPLFLSATPNVYTNSVTVGASVAAGTTVTNYFKAIDIASLSNVVSSTLSIMSGPPVVSAAASPNPVGRGQTAVISATVIPQSYPISSVTVDVTALGGSTVTLHLQGGNIYTNSVTVSPSAAFGTEYDLTVTATDTASETGTANIPLIIGGLGEVWNGNATPDNNWSTAGNWASGQSPQTGDLLTFAGTTSLMPDMNNSYSIGSLTFNSNAGSFNITDPTASYTLTLTGGVTNNSANVQTLSVPVALGGTQTFIAVSNSIVLSNSVADDSADNLVGGVVASGTNALILTGINTYSGPTTVNTNSMLTIGGSGQLGSGTYAAGITNNGVLNYNSSAAQTLSGAISGSGLLQNGAGILTLPNANTYTGGTLINGGVVSIANAASLGTGTVTNNGGTILMPTAAALTVANNLWFTGTSIVDQDNYVGNNNFSGTFSGNGTLIITNLSYVSSTTYSTFTIQGSMSGFAGAITVAPDSANGPTEGFIRFNSGTTVNNAGSALATFNLGGGDSEVILTERDPSINYLGALTGGPGTALEGSRNAGTATWIIGGLNTSTTFAGTIEDADATTEATPAGLIAAITKVGTGTLTLSGANAYSGGTIISNGVLNITGSLSTGVGGGTLNSVSIFGGTLAGFGTINVAVTNYSGGTFAPGAGVSTAGTVLTVNSNLTLLAGSTNIFQVSHINTTNDSVVSGGTITYGGVLTVVTNAGDSAFTKGDKFTLFVTNGVSGGYVGSFIASNLPPLSAGLAWTNTLAIDGSIEVISNGIVTPPAPVAGFSGTPTSGVAPLPVTFTDSSTGTITNWIWNLGDGTSVTNTSSINVNHTYAAGTYTVSLTVNGPGGSSTNTQVNYIVVTAAPPVAGFSGTPTNIFVTQTVTFTDASSGSITNWIWNFGDGHSVTNSSNASVNHAYAVVGTDTVSLIVNGPGGSSTNTRASYIAVKSKPVLGKPVLSGNSLILSGVNGPEGQQYRILSSTNVALPLASWTPVYTNTFNADGSYGYTNSTLVNKADFLLLVSP